MALLNLITQISLWLELRKVKLKTSTKMRLKLRRENLSLKRMEKIN
jgi:hypothetical protein